MKILVLGGGGREHALCYALSKSNLIEKLYAIPGNGGIETIATVEKNISINDFENIIKFCKDKNIDLVIPGPEEPLVNGIKNELEKEGIKVFGPDKIASQLEGSKIFAKKIMKKVGIPTADFEVFDNLEKAKEYIKKKKKPLVVKADGLCGGKGVFVCENEEEALIAVEKLMKEKIFGKAGEKVVIEEKLVGEEASYIIITDGKRFKALPTSQDHKRLLDGDKGPNTGGMGAYSPTPLINHTLRKKIEEKIIIPILQVMREEYTPYTGFLYVGLMIVNDEPYVLEFNCRLGDPEAQVILPRIKEDFLGLILNTIKGIFSPEPIKEDEKACVCVVMASKGYPGKYEKGKLITGIEEAEALKDVIVFHAGTKKEGNKFYTNGGRVLGVTALSPTLPEAINKAYEAVEKIHFEGAYYRKDIGHKAFKYF